MLSRRVFWASAILFSGRLLSRGVDMLAALVIARFLTPAAFGVVSLAIASLMIMRSITELPISEALIREEDLTPGHINTAFTLNCLRGLTVSSLMALAAYPMAWIYGIPALAQLMLALAIAPLVMGFNSPAMVRYSRNLNYLPSTTIDATAKIVAFVASITYAYMTHSYWALIISLVLPPMISVPLSYVLAPYRPRFSFVEVRSIFHFTGWVTLMRFISTANGEADRFFIGGILGKARLGEFSMSRSISTVASWAVGFPLVQAMFPGFSKLQGDRSRLASAYLKGQAMLVAVLAPIGIGLAVLAEPFVRLALGNQWVAIVPLIQILAPAGTISTMSMPAHSLAMATGHSQKLAIRDLVMFVIAFPAVVAGAYWWGVMGATVVRFFAGLVATGLSLQIVAVVTGVGIFRQLLNLWRTTIGVTVMGFFLYFGLTMIRVEHWALALPLQLAMLCLAGGLVYVLTHFLFWLFSGRPAGPETFVIDLFGPIYRQLLKRIQRNDDNLAAEEGVTEWR
jgi:PST family polysaccharide transporter